MVQNFKDNVQPVRSYRRGESALKGNVDMLRVSGNKQLIHGTNIEDEHSNEIERFVKGNNRFKKQKRHAGENNSTADKLTPRHIPYSIAQNDTGSDGSLSTDDDLDEDDNEISDLGNVGNAEQAQDHEGSSIVGQRYPSSHGPKMETIPEETEEVEVEMDDYRDLPRLTKRRLNLLNRSQSRRNIFDVNERVPLLPEVSGQHMETRAFVGRKCPDTADKETQTSDKSKSHLPNRKKESHLIKKKSMENGKEHMKKYIVVKLPRSVQIPIPIARVNSALSNSGDYGSEDTDEDDDNVENTDTDFVYGFESDLIASETDDYAELSDGVDADDESSNNPGVREQYSLTLTKYKTTLRRTNEKGKENSSFIHGIPTVTNIEANFPNITKLNIQNPYSVRYKERSFFLKSFEQDERPSGSAKFQRHTHNFIPQEKIPSPRHTHTENRDFYNQRRDVMKKPFMKETGKRTSKAPKIAVYGRKADYIAGTQEPSALHSPRPNCSHQGLSPRRTQTSTQLNDSLCSQQRTKAEQQETIQTKVNCEHVRRFERTRSGKIRPFRAPQIPTQENPSLKLQYYRDKLLKVERDSVLKERIKTRTFMDTFDSGRDSTKLQIVTSGRVYGSEKDAGNQQGKALRNVVFNVYQPEQNVDSEREIVPGVATTPLNVLKNCEYLREYKPMTGNGRIMSHAAKGTSWDTNANFSYLANEFLQERRRRLVRSMRRRVTELHNKRGGYTRY